MKRREFISAASSFVLPLTINGLGFKTFGRNSPFFSAVSQALAAEQDKVLVIIYLNGGNDGLNTVIPLQYYSQYYNLRSNIAIPEAQILRLSGNSEFGFHPVMTGMQELYNQGKLSIVNSVSYPNPNQSHYRSSDIWMTAVDAEKYSETGWAGRYLDKRFPGYPTAFPTADMSDPLAIQIGYINTTTLLGPSQPMNISIQNPGSFYQLMGNLNPVTDTTLPCCDAGSLIKFYREQQVMSVGYSAEIKAAGEKGTNLATYPAGVASNDLSEQLKVVARLIHGGLKTKIYYVELRGFDTHANQVSTLTTEGEHALLLKQLSDAVAAFQKDLALQGTENRVIGMTFSDFGRRANSNASKGTDHGVAAPMFIFGSGIKRQIVGTAPVLTTDLEPIVAPSWNKNQEIKMQIDFRRVYRDLLVDWLGAAETTSNSILYKNFTTTSLFSDKVQSLASGMWPDRSIWSTGRMPGPNDVVVINSGHTVSVGQDITAKSIQVEGNGELNLLGNYKVTTS
ncbi:Uncharacterized conserved protein, DUF1501 family [Dyadobacter sp. SG02]|uniref:DUF1501 domain-containing protein n=1 Tax=Dyadobacter sp. SG02 TaxID=1855291 RepID=UPI0008CE71AA|nr:DUF1501 domain-containing protein [Dyadobacter sp. SG02]SEJ72447.1 Uncharacterized conserved protein, DUF1501 family [Dyadobacter sp. SG02]